ncbi:DegV family protein [Cohnella lupini]|uniref:DegV family protein with EDD domain n=1 Tax=Cohnella lupini TaxID=1294267 RepID=A0A3D9IW68_9BACL|nr:DegV family protein [Cohnella lupini]RED65924.1 DegV family protein with EDD domain [Cohnella lupini]
MASVVIVTDSTADIPLEARDRLGISMVPLKVTIGDETYLDNITLQPVQFYEKLIASGNPATTSQPSPADFHEVYKKLTDEGHSVISIQLSAALSGTYQSATIAKSMLDDEADVTVIDSKSASYGYGMLVVTAAEMAKAGASKEEIIAEVHRLRTELRLYFLVDTLEYLKKGGRIGKASALLGALLNIKPILSIDDEGLVFPFDKVRGQKRAMARIAEVLESDFKDRPVTLVIAVTPGYSSGLTEISELLKERLNVRNYMETEIGPVIGTHAGPGTIGLFVFPERI